MDKTGRSEAGKRTPVGTLVPDNSEATVSGHLQDVRNLGGIAFVQLRDESGVVQLTCLKKEMGKEAFKELTEYPRESVVEVSGTVQDNPQAPGGMEVFVKSFRLLSRANTPLPMGVIDKVNVEFDTRLNNRFMDLRKREVGAVFRLKSVMLSGIREYLLGQGFLEVHTPKIVAQGAEGGATLFPIDYFGKEAYLAQSPQLYKQMLMGCDLGPVFEIAPAYRAEQSDTVRHVSEFLSLDVEIPYIAGPEEVFKNAEGVAKAGIRAMLENGGKLLDILGVELPEAKGEFPRITFDEARGLLAEKGKVLRDGEDLDTESEKLLGDIMSASGDPLYFITEFPTAIKKGTFYAMRREDRPELTTYADLDLLGQEVMSGGQREHRYDVLLKQLEEAELDPEAFEFYLQPFRYGMPPHGGYGFGVERFLQKLLGLGNIREVILFPRDLYRLTP